MMGFGFCFAKVHLFLRYMRFQESIYPLSNFLSDPTMLQKSWPITTTLGCIPKRLS